MSKWNIAAFVVGVLVGGYTVYDYLYKKISRAFERKCEACLFEAYEEKTEK